MDSHKGITKVLLFHLSHFWLGVVIFLWWIFAIFRKIFSKNNIMLQTPFFFKKKNLRKPIKLFLPKIIKVAYKMKWCFKFYIFIFWILPNLAKYIYGLITIRTTSQNWKTKLWLGAWSTNSSSRSKFTLAFFTKKNR